MKRILASSLVLVADVAWNVTGTAASKVVPRVSAISSVPVKQKHVDRDVDLINTSAPSKSFKTRDVHTVDESSKRNTSPSIYKIFNK